MAATPPYQQDGLFQGANYGDPAFEPHPGFDFADINDEVLRGMQNNDIASLDMFNNRDYSGFSAGARQSGHNTSTFSPFPVGTEVFAPSMNASVDPTNVSADVRASAFIPPASQTSIAAARSDSVAEKHGQVTPPDSTPPRVSGRKSSTVYSQSSKSTKPSKSERARHAANQRHAKSKQAPPARESSLSADVEEDEEDAEIRKEKYREKNRIAAAKCRAKKKDNTDGLEEQYRDLQASHNFLTREARKLRDEYSTLRTLALQHAPDTPGCGCSQIYTYNQCQAGEVVRNLGAPLVTSPTDSILSPSAFGGYDQMGSLPGGPLAESFSSKSSAFMPMATPDGYEAAMEANDSRVQQDLSRYLQGSEEYGAYQS